MLCDEHDFVRLYSIAYRSGVTSAVVAPKSAGFLSGLSVAFSTGARHQLEKGALVQEVVAVHVGIHHRAIPSVSTQIAALRHLLRGHGKGEVGHWFKKVTKVRKSSTAIDPLRASDRLRTLGPNPAGHQCSKRRRHSIAATP